MEDEKPVSPQGREEIKKLVCIPITREEIIDDLKTRFRRLGKIQHEFNAGFELIRKYPKSVTFYGSARFKPQNPHYRDARILAGLLAREGYAVVTGGGPGIMEAANRGAKEAGGNSIGLNIKLPAEQKPNGFVTDQMEFTYFFARRTALAFSSEAYIFYPGGFGTLDEVFEILTLVQTKKIREVPIILVGSDFWNPLNVFIQEHLVLRHGTVSHSELHLYHVLDDHQKIIEIVKRAPVRC